MRNRVWGQGKKEGWARHCTWIFESPQLASVILITPFSTVGILKLFSEVSMLRWSLKISRAKVGRNKWFWVQGVFLLCLNTGVVVYGSCLASSGDFTPVLGKRACLQCRSGFDPWVLKIPWRKEWQPILLFLPGEFTGLRSLAGYSPWSHKVRQDWVTNTFSLTVAFLYFSRTICKQ